MKTLFKSILKYICIFIFFGGLYYLIESCWKGFFTNWRMFILSGVIGVLIGCINNAFSYDTSFLLQCLIGTFIALLCECILGYEWNVVQNLGLWNYSNLPLSYVADQINVFFGIIWFIFSAICIYIDDYIRWKFFGEKKPTYKL